MVFLSLIALIFVSASAVQQDNFLSPQALIWSGNKNVLYVALGSTKQVAIFDIESTKVVETIDVPAEPTGLRLSADEAYLYVTCAAPKGCLCVIDTVAKVTVKQIPVGNSPRSPVRSPDGNMLYVCNRFSNDISVISLKEDKQITRINVLREPYAADITPDGKWLYVGHHLPDGPADIEFVACKVLVIDTKTMKVDAAISLPNGGTGLRDVNVSPDGQYVYVTHILARYKVPTSQLEKGWMNTNALSIIDAKKKELIETVLLDDVDNGAANPWAVGCTNDGKYICISHAGTDELSIIDASTLHNKISSIEHRASSVENELSFLYGIRHRVKLCGKGPRALAIVGSFVYVAEYFTDSITSVDLKEKFFTRQSSLVPLLPQRQACPRPCFRRGKLVPAQEGSGDDSMKDGRWTPVLSEVEGMDMRRRGEMLFNDASLCFQQWQSCASCHPDGRSDALNWDLLNDGIGNPKNTKSLLFSHKTPPTMITGVRDRAETAVRAGIKHIQFMMRPEQDAVAIDEYLKSLQPVPSPYLARRPATRRKTREQVNDKLSKAGRRGRKIFKKAGCASCHSGPLYTDLQKYDVGTGRGLDKDRQFDMPTLVEVWRTAPYLYDGRAATMKEVLTTYNPNDKHGVTSNLTENEINDLAEFVLSQ